MSGGNKPGMGIFSYTFFAGHLKKSFHCQRNQNVV